MGIMLMILSFTLLLLIAIATGYLAKGRGRDPAGWVLIGLLLGIFALVLLYVLPNRAHLDDAKVDLKDDQYLSIGSAPTKQGFYSSDWYYLDSDHRQYGPLSLDRLRDKWDEEVITQETLVWCEGMAEWSRVKAVPDLQEAIEPRQLRL